MSSTFYGAYKLVPKKYYIYDGTYKEYVKFFETELDCARYCIEHDYKYDTLYLTPDSAKINKEHFENSKNYR